MALPEFTLRQLLEAGVHFGHQTQRWNPRMEEFIYGERNGIHIMDLTQTVPMLDAALNIVRETVAKGGRILFVGTKRQASTAIAEAAEKCAQYYMNHRWLGGTLTNWQTVSQSISRLKSLDEKMTVGSEGLTKKERLGMEREQSKLQASLGGITQMGGVPDLLFVIDVKKEALAVAEANKLGIPVIAVVDTNCSPSGIDYLIPGNDDAARAIALYCDLIARSALDGMTEQMGAAGVDLGEMEDVPLETAVEAPVEEATTGEAPKEEATTNEVAAEEAVVEKADTIAETEIAPKEKAKAKAKKEEVDNNETSSEEENGKVKEKVKASKAKTAKK
jgi:small subunit ribosomal protein S2